ncbi:hypothetical protein [Deinococcus hohokamensis]|uniref:DNA-binding protein n=1 Tax=Deinococcus hohokamensis TaxID=309883 RepID=A0ABV9IH25_9DEIO
MKTLIWTALLGLSVAWAATVVGRVDVVDGTGRVVASGSMHRHLETGGNLAAGRTVRVHVVVDGVPGVREFVLAGPVTGRSLEAEHLNVRVGGQVISLERALKLADGRRSADDGAQHDAGDDRGGHGADDSAGHDAGDDHGSGGRHGGDDGSGHH